MNIHLTGPEILAHVHGELDAAAELKARAHCAECAECAAERDAMLDVLGLLAADAASETPAAVWSRVRAEALGSERPGVTPLFAMGTVAACLLGLMIGLWAGQGQNDGADLQTASGAGSLDYLWSTDDGNAFLSDMTLTTGRNTR